ncbi:hypothetical protein ACFWY5_07960 [Nonomuraea sp. NPDC059007]|uniref:hypothetical protein n=1 Tax=Nonomuraea sp. NPDC059007 TaxID=3346692 RepID=UPI0036C339BB
MTSQEARALAAAGLTGEFAGAAALALTCRDAVTGEPDVEAGVFRFNPGKAAYYAAEAHTAVGDFPRAMVEARRPRRSPFWRPRRPLRRS